MVNHNPQNQFQKGNKHAKGGGRKPGPSVFQKLLNEALIEAVTQLGEIRVVKEFNDTKLYAPTRIATGSFPRQRRAPWCSPARATVGRTRCDWNSGRSLIASSLLPALASARIFFSDVRTVAVWTRLRARRRIAPRACLAAERVFAIGSDKLPESRGDVNAGMHEDAAR